MNSPSLNNFRIVDSSSTNVDWYIVRSTGMVAPRECLHMVEREIKKKW